jgi:2-methylcitrate dehydratase PrpD
MAPFDRVCLVLRDGRTLASEPVRHPRGHFRRPVEREELWQKFHDCAVAAVRPDRARSLFEALQNLSRLSSTRDLARSDRRAAGAVG